MITKIEFENYKLFKRRQSLELKPITILIGKNNSGKSAVLKLPTLIENSLSGNFQEPLLLSNNGVELGGEFRDLVYGRDPGRQLGIALESDCGKLEIAIGVNTPNENEPAIFFWKENDTEIDVSNEKFQGFWPTSKKKTKRGIFFQDKLYFFLP